MDVEKQFITMEELKKQVEALDLEEKQRTKFFGRKMEKVV